MATRRKCQRKGAILVLTGLLLLILLGMVALAVDLGWIMVTRTQLQAASDSGSLAGGTELVSGLGASKWRTPSEVQAAAEVQAVAFTAQHPAGEAVSTHIIPARDVTLGSASLDTESGAWSFQWGVAPYNAVGVTTQRSSVGSEAGDGPLPLIFGPVLGQSFSDVTVVSAAVVMPASGIQIPPGSGISSGLSPFAFAQERWEKYWRARQYFQNNNMAASDLDESNLGHEIMDSEDVDENGDPTPLFYEMVEVGNSGNYEPRQLFDDKYRVVDQSLDTPENIQLGEDGVLEANIYPLANEGAGNFGTVDIGGLDNSTADLSRQIVDGVSEEDMSDYQDNLLDPSPEAPVQLQGDTGVSSGLQHALEEIVGQCRAIVLYSVVNDPGNNAMYTIVEIVGIRFVAVELQDQDKVLVIQPCSLSDPAAVPDYDEEIGDDTTFFSPLILAR